ncbi:hypothetical protein [Geodermatophilus sp. URMC 64]
MRGPLSYDDIERLEFSARTPKAHRAAAQTLVTWAEEPHPQDDDVTPAEFLNAAAWHLAAAGDDDAALQMHRRAVAAPGHVEPDARCYLHLALLRAGLRDEADRIADEVRRAAPTSADVYVFMAENYEITGDLKQTHRWLAMGTSRLLPPEARPPADDDYRALLLLRSRRRIRQQLGFPEDDLDPLVPVRWAEDDEA